MISPDKVIKTMLLTEKSNKASAELGQYTFEVFPGSTKHTIREAVEQAFSVTVTRVNVINTKGKPTRSRRGLVGHKSDQKKAIVTLKHGDKIEIV